MKRCKAGFTLIELLVVLGIITLFAALAFPVFVQAREQARQAAYTSHLRQLGLGIFQYMHDYDGTLFPLDSGDPPSPGREYTGWYFDTTASGAPDFSRSYVGPYVQDRSLLECPSMPTDPHDNIRPAYGLNIWGLYYPHRPYSVVEVGDHRPITFNDVEMPAETLLLGDSACYEAGSLSRSPTISPDDDTYAAAHGRHNGFANLLWLDGHVHALEPVQAHASISGAAEAHVGRVLKYPYSGQEARDAYYFEMRKPQ